SRLRVVLVGYKRVELGDFERAEVPELVPHNRPSEGNVVLPIEVVHRRVLDKFLKLRGQVAALEVVMEPKEAIRTSEGVPSELGNRVGPHPGGGEFSGVRGDVVHHLLQPKIVRGVGGHLASAV